MKVLLLTWGSRGHVQPFVSLARELNAAGHDAVLAAPAGSAALAAAFDVRFECLHDPMHELVADPKIQHAFEINFRGLIGKTLALHVRRTFAAVTTRVVRDMAAVADDGADVIVHDPIVPGYAGHHIAEHLNIPSVPVCLEPMWVPTSRFRNPLVPYRLPSQLNRMSYVVTRLWFGGFVDRDPFGASPVGFSGPPLQRRRRHNVLRRPNGQPATLLQVFSRHILPSPHDYPAWVHTTGFWLLPTPATWAPPLALTEFLAAGPPPVYVGFGSAVGTDPLTAGSIVRDAVRSAGVRAVVVAGAGGIRTETTDGDIFYLRQAPFDWLFPQMAAIVHHGGAGTTGDALAAGRPQVVCPFMTTQPFFGKRLHAAGVAPAPIPQHRLTAENLGRAIAHAARDRSMAKNATELGQRVRAERGAAAAVEIFESSL
ncbi:glycosyltransferase [Jiangella gansuensis]|uniref:glycosyltransferase n=1 Tax=Jiangella gansuensis TaxID=281473 RepID=UPI000479C9F3|nr:glycosyltransferase [Jiangella gansuensis]